MLNDLAYPILLSKIDVARTQRLMIMTSHDKHVPYYCSYS